MSSRKRGVMFSASGRPRRQRIVVFDESVPRERWVETLAGCRGHILRELPLLNAVVVLVDEDEEMDVQHLMNTRAGVARVDDDIDIHLVAGRPRPRGLLMRLAARGGDEVPWGVARLGLDGLPYTGKGVRIAVLDTGIDVNHPDLRTVSRQGFSVIDGKRPTADDNGHGTHVAGTIAAQRNGIGIVGVAPGATVYSVKVLDEKGSGKLSGLIEGLSWCIDHRIRVANLSLSSSTENQTFRDAIAAARKAGITLVCAAGNNGPGPNTVGYPAKFPEAVAVAATDENDEIATFSARGKEITVAAPGVNIKSTWPKRRYKTTSGTSMASPHVTGVVALMLEADPSLTPSEIKAVLQSTAARLPDLKPEEQGAGMINAASAIERVARKRSTPLRKEVVGA
jgi:subtilisin